MLKNNELQFRNVVRMNPVFRRVTDKACLASTGSAVSLDRASSRPYDIIEFRKFDNVGIVVVGKKWLRF
jgi:hypothetical protein